MSPVPAELPVALLLPGQGSQFQGMATGLYGREEAFTEAMDSVFAALGTQGSRLRDDWLAEQPSVDINHVTRSQMLLFAVDYALGRSLLSRGVRPRALLGHSVGEMAAAALAGVFRLEDAVRLMWDRVTRLAAGPAGGMLAVAASEQELLPLLDGDVVVGAVNAPRQTVVAGPEPALSEVTARVRAAGRMCRRVPATTPFHSPVLGPFALPAAALYAEVPIREPEFTLHSGYRPGPLSGSALRDSRYWAAQPVEPVQFWPALGRLLADGDTALVECGPGRGLTTVARRHPVVLGGQSLVTALLPGSPAGPERELELFEAAVAQLPALIPASSGARVDGVTM